MISIGVEDQRRRYADLLGILLTFPGLDLHILAEA
jgi:hypothetical protein